MYWPALFRILITCSWLQQCLTVWICIKRTTTHFTENEQFYRRLLQSLRLLVSNREEILIVALSIGNRIEHRAIYFSEYINVDHSTWVTTAITVLGAVYIIGNISFR